MCSQDGKSHFPENCIDRVCELLELYIDRKGVCLNALGVLWELSNRDTVPELKFYTSSDALRRHHLDINVALNGCGAIGALAEGDDEGSNALIVAGGVKSILGRTAVPQKG